MDKEIEVKILDIDVGNIRTLLEKFKFKFKFDRVQRLVTYDFHPLNSTFMQLNYEMQNITDKTNLFVLQSRVKRFLYEFFDIISNNDKKIILNEVLSEFCVSELFQPNVEHSKLDMFFNSEKCIDIVKKYSINPNKWIRIRTDGIITTMATKHIKRDTSSCINEYAIDAVNETEIQINDFNTGIELMKQLGYCFRNYQEKRRIMYVSESGIEVDIDFWPMIPPYLEIEGKSEEEVYNMVNLLGFNNSDVKIANTDDIYKMYGLDIYSFPVLKLSALEGDDVEL